MHRNILPLALLLTGCVTASPTYGPDGRRAYTIECDGVQHSIGDCYQKAGQLCGAKGYNILTGAVEHGAAASNYFAATSSHRSLVISCKP